MEEQHKSVSLAILGVVAVIAVVGLVLLFAQQNSATGQVYGGALKGDPYPYWSERGTPRNVPELQWATNPVNLDATTNWNWYATPKRSPGNYLDNGVYAGDIPSVASGCGSRGLLVSYQLADYYTSKGYQSAGSGSGAGVCVYPPGTMIGGVV